MDSKSYDEIQKKVPELVKMKRKYLKEKREKEHYKRKASLHEESIKWRDGYIEDLKKSIDELKGNYLLLEGIAKEQNELMEKYVNNDPIREDTNYLN